MLTKARTNRKKRSEIWGLGCQLSDLTAAMTYLYSVTVEACEFMVANMAMTHHKMEVTATYMTLEMHQMISSTIDGLCNHWIFQLT
jgi:hypothetical protein